MRLSFFQLLYLLRDKDNRIPGGKRIVRVLTKLDITNFKTTLIHWQSYEHTYSITHIHTRQGSESSTWGKVGVERALQPSGNLSLGRERV